MDCNSCGGEVYDSIPCADCGGIFCGDCATMIMCECGRQLCNKCMIEHNCETQNI